MNKKDLITLLLIPIIIVGYSVYGLQQFEIIKLNNLSNSQALKTMDSLSNTIEASTAEETKNNLMAYIGSTKKLIELEQGSEQLYIDYIRTTLRDALICSVIWSMLLLLVFYKSRKCSVK